MEKWYFWDFIDDFENSGGSLKLVDLKVFLKFLIQTDLSNFPVIQYSIRTFMNVHEWSETSINTVDRRRLR